jgi:hypothetical protein
MKANELMIGNYVKDPYGKEIRLVSVDADASMLTPIEITDWKLLDLGFSHSSERIDGELVEEFRFEDETIKRDIYGFYHTDTELQFKYVHTLQNFFTLLGKTLELVSYN